MKKKVIIIGNSFSTRLGVIRSVGETDYEVIVIAIVNNNTANPSKPIDCYSKYVNQVLFFDRKYDREGLVQLLLEKCTDKHQKPIIIPTSDFTAVAIDNEEIRKHFLVPYINNAISSIEYWMDKANQKSIAIQAGLNVAGSTIIEKKTDTFIATDTVKYPCFTKPLASLGAGKRCMKRCCNKLELQGVLNIADKNNIEKILVEDYLDINEEYAVLGFSDGSDVIIPGVIKFIRECQSHKGTAMVGEVLPVTDFKEIIDKFSCFIRKIGLVGLFDIDFFKCQGDYYFGELNLRIGGSGSAISEMGVNLPVMFIKTMLGEDIDNMSRLITRKATFLNEKMAIADFNSGYMSMREYKRLVNSAEIYFVSDESDSAPYEAMQKELGKNILNCKRIIKRIQHIKK